MENVEKFGVACGMSGRCAYRQALTPQFDKPYTVLTRSEEVTTNEEVIDIIRDRS